MHAKHKDRVCLNLLSSNKQWNCALFSPNRLLSLLFKLIDIVLYNTGSSSRSLLESTGLSDLVNDSEHLLLLIRHPITTFISEETIYQHNYCNFNQYCDVLQIYNIQIYTINSLCLGSYLHKLK